VIPAGIRFHDAGIYREALALDETRVHARPHHRLEHLPKDVARAEATVAIDRER
jgi:hypothetical protein